MSEHICVLNLRVALSFGLSIWSLCNCLCVLSLTLYVWDCKMMRWSELRCMCVFVSPTLGWLDTELTCQLTQWSVLVPQPPSSVKWTDEIWQMGTVLSMAPPHPIIAPIIAQLLHGHLKCSATCSQWFEDNWRANIPIIGTLLFSKRSLKLQDFLLGNSCKICILKKGQLTQLG